MKNFIKQYGYLLLMFLTYSVCEPNLEVKTKNGIVRGRILKDPRTDKEFYAFSAIPFAKPPVGELRFKAPKPVENWSGVRDATKEGPVCPQISVMSGKFEGNEDCLHLNVYTPEVSCCYFINQ
ncbi:hypothetical protein C0J52_24734 [Blattella germanica]|nr:hypothetical protein C0J52_24734 [Blattella germanica]